MQNLPRSLHYFWHAAAKYPVRLSIVLTVPITTVVVGSFVVPYIISILLNQLQTGQLSVESASPLLVAYIVSQVYGEIIGWRIVLYAVWTMESAAQRDLFHRIFTTLSDHSLSFHANRFGGSLVSQATKFTGSFERFWDTIIFSVIPSVVSVVAATVILSFVFWQYALFLFILSLIFAAVVWYSSRFMAHLNTEESQANTVLTGRIADMVTNITAVKSYGHESSELKDFEKLTATWREKNLNTMKGFLGVSTIYSTLLVIINVAALFGALWATSQHIINIGVVYLCVTYTFTVARQLWEMNSIMRNFNRVIGDAHDMAAILDLKTDVQDKPDAAAVKSGEGAIDFDHMKFTHGDSSEGDILFNNFMLQIKPREKIGLVGHSGSGKTTLTRLLLRFMDLDGGAIRIDGQDISAIRQSDLRQLVAYVPQEPMLFHRSLRENIAYGKPDATQEEILEAARKAHALEFIEKLPQGFETLVGERGVKLSGGQRQRIAIARAILKDAPILVLDEATSALDSESEKLIQTALAELMKNRTAIVIAHRLSTIQKMDRIVVLENGTISEQGSHAELLAARSIYAGLWKHQSGGFIEE
jgi:ATP-binding cassette subfamily B protein